MNEELATALHESSHTVMAFLVGAPQIYVAITGETTGETVPECAMCPSCREYYWHHDPATDIHSRSIRDEYRKDAAVAIAGEVGETLHTGRATVLAPNETNDDRWKVRGRTAAVHFWSGDQQCYEFGEWQKMGPCGLCETFIEKLRVSVEALLAEPNVRQATNELALKLLAERRIEWESVTDFLQTRGLLSGPAFGKLPPPP